MYQYVSANVAITKDSQIYLVIGSGSYKKLEPVSISLNTMGEDSFGNKLPFILTYRDGKQHQIGYNWYFVV